MTQPQRSLVPRQRSLLGANVTSFLCSGDSFASVSQSSRSSVSLYQRHLVTALVCCLVPVGQRSHPEQAALALLHQLVRIEHDSLASDTAGLGSQCKGCGIAIHICAWKVSISFQQCTCLQACCTCQRQSYWCIGQSRSQTEEEHVVHDVQGRSSNTACEACQQGQHPEGNQTYGKHHLAACAQQPF